jgi:hypothetical protein
MYKRFAIKVLLQIVNGIIASKAMGYGATGYGTMGYGLRV